MMRRTVAAVTITAWGAGVVLLVGAGSALAGQFSVASCIADQKSGSTSAFMDFATRGMKIVRSCGRREDDRGMVTGNVVRAGSVPLGATSKAFVEAPPGTIFTSLTWAGRLQRVDCGYSLRVYAERPDESKIPFENVRANESCPKNGFAQAGYAATTKDVSGATRIVQQISCQSPPGEACSARYANYILTKEVRLDVLDVVPPLAKISPGTPLADGAWVNGVQPLMYDAQDNVGVRQATVISPRGAGSKEERPCRLASDAGAFANTTPCPNGAGQIQVQTSELDEGSQLLVVQAQDAANNTGDSDPVVALIDRTAPHRVDVGVDGGEGWRNRNDFALSWVNTEEVDRAPVVAAVYRLCPVAGGACRQVEQAGVGIAHLPVQVPGPGAWTVSLWRRDEAGNADPGQPSVPVALRYDPDAPRLAFESQSVADPTAVAVRVSDELSGLADGSIEIGLAGSNTWQGLSTQKTANGLSAVIDDAVLPAGDYVLRATARDQAGNEASTTLRVDGQAMAVTLPLRSVSVMQVGVPGQRTVRRIVQVHGRRRTVTRRESVLRPAAGVVFGSQVHVAGRLTNRDGQGIAGAEVQVLSRSDAGAEQLVAVLQTDAAGNYAYAAPGSASRVLRFAYAGSAVILPVQGEVRLRVPATSTLRASRTRLTNGQSVTFSGQLRTLPVPAGGKLVELQVLLSGRWQTFRTGRTDQTGRWALPYRFARTRALARFRFRLRLAHEAGYPFADGRSRSVQVTVNGR